MRPILLSLVVLVACGDNRAAAVDASPAVDAAADASTDGCRTVDVGAAQLRFEFTGQVLGLRFPLVINEGGDAPDYVAVELYDSYSAEGRPPLVPGTFDLSAAPDDDYPTCQHCALIEVDAAPRIGDPPATFYFQASGTMTLTDVSDPFAPNFAGSLTRVTYREATLDDTGHVTFVDGGDCLATAPMALDPTPAFDMACESAADCAAPDFQVCDPFQAVCTAPQCTYENPSCGDGTECWFLYEPEVSQNGACYPPCNPRDAVSGCDGDRACVQVGVVPDRGLCLLTGDGAVGEACRQAEITTSCVDGANCSDATDACRQGCDFFAADPGCAGDTRCSLFGACEPTTLADPAALHEACAGDADVVPCGTDDERFVGYCFSFEGPKQCEEACLGNEGCEPEEFCALRFSSGLGICLPDPVCGDGELGEINETCDDGNVASGDGCSGDCQTVGYSFLCAAAPTLPLGTPVQGNTASGVDGFFNGCQAGSARSVLWEVAAPGPGRLTLTLEAVDNQTLALRSDCVDDTSQLTCGYASDAPVVLQITDIAPAALTLFVTPFNLLEAGPFTITADFVPELCGDGILAGREVCDDGNQVDGDGCAGTCTAIEYDFYCAAATALSVVSTNAGNLTGDLNIYENSCDLPVDVGGSGVDQLFHFTAPSDGTLRLEIVGDDHFIDVVIRDGCGAPVDAPELACAPWFIPDPAIAHLTAGQNVSIIVNGYYPDVVGPFELDATFTAD